MSEMRAQIPDSGRLAFHGFEVTHTGGFIETVFCDGRDVLRHMSKPDLIWLEKEIGRHRA